VAVYAQEACWVRGGVGMVAMDVSEGGELRGSILVDTPHPHDHLPCGSLAPRALQPPVSSAGRMARLLVCAPCLSSRLLSRSSSNMEPQHVNEAEGVRDTRARKANFFPCVNSTAFGFISRSVVSKDTVGCTGLDLTLTRTPASKLTSDWRDSTQVPSRRVPASARVAVCHQHHQPAATVQ